ncbi:glycosyltransferase family 1 protein [Streptomyces spinoverrucosus]|uniref:glycosyltransferase n=1 Tax=Streptomyces spinoverrucosus TaxID=284043 RepID=UPI0018C41998|nr:glycosyltransferase [Streptomyces spinoverrucosus]MBG0850657.1 glycosyltransferase family 1 protein [Streptomyces spinoverrucosus]
MTAGSRGDVAPYTGLGLGLLRAGHEVTLVTHGCFEPLVAGSGMGFHALPVDPRAELESGRGRGLHRSATGVGKLLRVVSLARSVAGRMTDGLVTAARASDVLLLAGSVVPLGHTIAEGLSLPSMGVYLQPLTTTREFAPPMLATGSWGPVGNQVAGHGVALAVERVFAAAVPTVRARLGLPPARPGAGHRQRERRLWPVQHGFSPLVVPRPRDWRPGLDIAGYWWPYDRETELPDELREFLEAGPPPVFVGLGSATVPDAEGLSASIVAALRRAGLRGVIQRGWGELRGAGDDMITIGDVAHSALFPHMAAVVHHAGAGTTAAGLRAGVPAVPVPIQFDAGFWARRLVRLGVAPCAVPLRHLTADTLTAALVRATREAGFRRRAAALGTRIRAEDGVGPVLQAVHRLTR